ncbi:hypothetical protein L1887_18028 [Cichorium endivia]|nr:hypothetical protein L1887_18028 [Cichorium endivia]
MDVRGSRSFKDVVFDVIVEEKKEVDMKHYGLCIIVHVSKVDMCPPFSFNNRVAKECDVGDSEKEGGQWSDVEETEDSDDSSFVEESYVVKEDVAYSSNEGEGVPKIDRMGGEILTGGQEDEGGMDNEKGEQLEKGKTCTSPKAICRTVEDTVINDHNDNNVNQEEFGTDDYSNKNSNDGSDARISPMIICIC